MGIVLGRHDGTSKRGYLLRMRGIELFLRNSMSELPPHEP
jgi:hypothetical protein